MSCLSHFGVNKVDSYTPFLQQLLDEHVGLREQLLGNFESNATPEAVHSLIEACNLLLNHFDKEERILFPLAQRLLSEEEKQALLR